MKSSCWSVLAAGRAALPCGLFHGVAIRLFDVHRDPRDWTHLVGSTPCAVFLKIWTVSGSLTPVGNVHTTAICSSGRSATRTTLAPSGSANGEPSPPDCACSLLWPDSRGIAQFDFLDLADNPRPQSTSLDCAFSTWELGVRHREREQKKWVAAHRRMEDSGA